MTTTLTKSKPTLNPDEVMAKIPEGPWWYFNQNNSGGYYIGPKNVLLVAPTEEAAWERLRDMPDYTSQHCDCCGSRWGWAEEMTKAEAVARIVDLSSPEHFDNTFHPEAAVTLLVMPEHTPNKVSKALEF